MFPVLARELLVSLRMRQRFANLAFLLLSASLITAIVWGVFRARMFQYDSPILGRAVFIGMAFLQLLMGCMTGFWSAKTVAGEHEANTWDLLMVAPIRTAWLVIEKAAVPVLNLFLLFIGLVPILSLCFLLGGISPNEAAAAYVIIFSGTTVAAMMGILASSFCRTEIGAFRLNAIFVFLYLIVLPALAVFCITSIYDYLNLPSLNVNFTRPEVWVFVVASVNLLSAAPMFAMFFVFFGPEIPWYPGVMPGSGPAVSVLPWLSSAFFSSLIFLFVFFLIQRRLWRTEQYNRPQENETAKKVKLDTSVQWGFRDRRNPVAQREILIMQRGRFGGIRMKLLQMTIATLLLMGVLMSTHIPEDCWQIIIVSVFLAVSLVGVTATPGAIAGERVRETWDSLRCTLLSHKQILNGKLISAAWSVLQTAVLFSAFLIVAATILPNDLWGKLPPLVSLSVFLCGIWGMQVCSGLYFSVVSSTTGLAQLRSTFLCVFHVGGAILIYFLVSVAVFILNPASTVWFRNVSDFWAYCTPAILILGESDWIWGQWGSPVLLAHGFVATGIAVGFFYAARRRLRLQYVYAATSSSIIPHNVTEAGTSDVLQRKG